MYSMWIKCFWIDLLPALDFVSFVRLFNLPFSTLSSFQTLYLVLKHKFEIELFEQKFIYWIRLFYFYRRFFYYYLFCIFIYPIIDFLVIWSVANILQSIKCKIINWKKSHKMTKIMLNLWFFAILQVLSSIHHLYLIFYSV